MQDCGNCANFQKLKHMVGNSGLCEWYDGRTDTDCGHKCKHHKAMKYERTKPLNLEEEND